LLDEPDDVAGEQRHLLGAQRHTGNELVLFGEGHAIVHKGFVLILVTRVALQEALTGEQGDLLTDELLLVEAIAQALFRGGRIVTQSAKHGIGTDPGFVIGKARIGFDQIMPGGCGRAGQVQVKEAVVGQGD